jgi:glycosyltransferase involved in cell wall biosynthesis
MRITFLCSAHSLGDERVVCRHALTLAQTGHLVTVLGRGDHEKTPPSHPNLILKSVEPFIRGATIQARYSRIRALRKLYLSALQFSPDVIIANEPDSALIGVLIKIKAKIPIVFDVHEYYEELLAARLPAPFSHVAQRLCWFFLSRLALKCDWIMVVSDDMESQYRRISGVRNVATILNSPPVERFPQCNHLTDEPVTLCHEGWMDSTRGMEQLIAALAIARKCVDVRLLVVGSIRTECREQFSELIESNDLSDAVILTGWVPYDKVGTLDAQAQIGLVTLQPSGNNYRGLSNKLFSYMACGHAVIVPCESATQALVDSCNGGVAVDVTSPQAIAEAIIMLTGNPKLRQQFGENNRRSIVEKYGWNVMASKLESIVAGCIH